MKFLPLLRDTFGAAFTVKEGETLRATLGDPNYSPAEKDAVLSAFIDQKNNKVMALKRQIGQNPYVGQGNPAINTPYDQIPPLMNLDMPVQPMQGGNTLPPSPTQGVWVVIQYHHQKY